MGLYEALPDDLRIYAQKPLEQSHLVGRKYNLRITDEMEHSRGVAWVGELRSGKKLVAIVENAGNGGCNDYIVKDDALWHTFCMDAYIAYGNSSESKDSLVQLIDIASVVVS